MTIRQFADEKVEEYGRRFKKLLRKVNSGNSIVPDLLQVRMFLYGLTPLLTPLVATHNPAMLDDAIERAKIVETGYNYVPTKQASFSTVTSTRENPTIKDLTSGNKNTLSNAAPDVDRLSDQLQKLTLNYANLTTALL